MGRQKRRATVIEGDREAAALSATLGGQARAARRRQKLRLADVAPRVAVSPTHLSRIERGEMVGLPLRTWVRLGVVLGQPLAVRLTEPMDAERLVDAGHLELQEWTLRRARERGWSAGLEIPTRPTDPRHSVDVLVRAGRLLLLFECWNTVRDFGAAVRSTDRKLAELEELGVALGVDGVAACWLVRPTAANRAIVRAYPEAIRARFHGRSRGWKRMLDVGGEPPVGLGFVWLDPRSGLSDLRLRGESGRG